MLKIQYQNVLSAQLDLKGPSEIIVVDDFSNDNTVSVVNNLAKNYPIIKLIKLKNNVGPVAARDFGVDAHRET